MRVKVLGSAAGGGFPQWNCGCSNCSRLRTGTLKGCARTQTQLAISPSEGVWLLVGACPDLRQQLIRDPEFAPASALPPSQDHRAGESRGTPIQAVLLTSADIDSVLGLLHLREFQPFRILSTAAVHRILTEENVMFRALARSRPPVAWESLALNQPMPIFQPVGSSTEESLSCRAVPLSGKFPDYVTDRLSRSLPENEAVIGLEFMHRGKRLFCAPALSGRGNHWKDEIGKSDVALLDGTFFTDDELVKIRPAGATAHEMGHLPLAGPNGLLAQLESMPNTRRILIHLNNTNPALDEDSAAARILRDAGYEVAYDGMEFTL